MARISYLFMPQNMRGTIALVSIHSWMRLSWHSGRGAGRSVTSGFSGACSLISGVCSVISGACFLISGTYSLTSGACSLVSGAGSLISGARVYG